MTTINPVLLELPASFETGRLRMRVPQPGDGAIHTAAIAESVTELRAFLASIPWIGSEPGVDVSETYCRKSAANFLSRTDLPFLVFEKAGGELVGGIGLHRPVWETPKLEVGYWVRTRYGGRGFVTEAVNGLCDYAFTHAGAVRLDLVTDAQNLASRRVAERCGFQLEGVLRHERRAPDGSLRDTCMYGRLAPQAA